MDLARHLAPSAAPGSELTHMPQVACAGPTPHIGPGMCTACGACSRIHNMYGTHSGWSRISAACGTPHLLGPALCCKWCQQVPHADSGAAGGVACRSDSRLAGHRTWSRHFVCCIQSVGGTGAEGMPMDLIWLMDQPCTIALGHRAT